MTQFPVKVYAVVSKEMFEEIKTHTNFMSTASLIRIALSEYLQKKKNAVSEPTNTDIRTTHTKGGYNVKHS